MSECTIVTIAELGSKLGRLFIDWSIASEGTAMPNTGLFYLFEVEGNPSQATQATCGSIGRVVAQCLACQNIMRASKPPELLNIVGGGAVLQCPACPNRQAISGARFAEFMQRFPTGNLTGRVAATAQAADDGYTGMPIYPAR